MHSLRTTIQRNSWLILMSLVSLYILCFSFLAIRQHTSFKTQMNDLGNLVQSLDNTLNGNFMQMSNVWFERVESIHRWSGHTNFYMLALIPIYQLFGINGLLVLQVVMVSLTTIPLFLLSKYVMPKQPLLWLLVPIIFLLNPSVQDASLFDPHAIVFAMPVLAMALYFLLIKKYRWMFVSSFLLMLFKEDMSLLVLMMGGYLFLFQKEKKLGSLLGFMGLSFFVFITQLYMPSLQNWPAEDFYGTRYGDLGNSISEIILTGITKPWILLKALLTPNKIWYAIALLSGFIFLPVNALPVALISAPSWFINLLSVNPITQTAFGFYYPAPILTILAISSVVGLKKMAKKKNLNQFVLTILGLSLGFSFWLSPAPYSLVSSWEEFLIVDRTDELSKLKKEIPSDARLSVQNNLGPHFADREYIVSFPTKLDQVDFILLDVNDPYTKFRTFPRQRNMIHLIQMDLQEYYDQILALIDGQDFGVSFLTESGFVVFERGASDEMNQEAKELIETKMTALSEKYTIQLIESAAN